MAEKGSERAEEWKRSNRRKRSWPLKNEAFDEQKYVSTIDEKIKNHSEQGGFDELPGKGKPLRPEAVKGSALEGVLKHNNVLPPWLELQHKIRDEIGDLLEKMEKGYTDIQEDIHRINERIATYNNQVPQKALQKSKISSSDVRAGYREWS